MRAAQDGCSGLGRILKDKRLWLLVGLVLAMLAMQRAGAWDLLSFDTLRTHRQTLQDQVERHGALAALAFVVFYACAVALSFPGALLLTLTGGLLFGPWLGTVLNVTGATTGACAIFLAARGFLGPSALDRFGETAGRLARNIRANAWSYLLVVRLVPLFPFFLVNLVPAFAGVRLPVFAGTTFLGIMPATAVYTSAGAGLGALLDQGEAPDLGDILTPEILFGLLGLALLSLAAIPLRKRFARP